MLLSSPSSDATNCSTFFRESASPRLTIFLFSGLSDDSSQAIVNSHDNCGCSLDGSGLAGNPPHLSRNRYSPSTPGASPTGRVAGAALTPAAENEILECFRAASSLSLCPSITFTINSSFELLNGVTGFRIFCSHAESVAQSITLFPSTSKNAL